MDNKIYNIGDSIVIEVKPKQKGTAIIENYIDELINVTENRTVYREYRIVEDELFYADWRPLTSESIKGVRIKQNNSIQIRYTRTGKDSSSFIEFKSIEFGGDFEPEVINSPILNGSMFANIAWTDETEKLAKNLFKKLYFRGIIPTYILRGDNIDAVEDEDCITLFYTIAKFYAIILRFFQRFENFFEDEELMLEWIRQNGIYFDESSITLEQLQYLASHLYNEIRNRGTKMIFNRQGDVVNDKINGLDGEFIRLIRGTSKDELLYENIKSNHLGWCLQQSSPLYRGTLFSDDINKTKERTKDFQNKDNFQNFALRNGAVTIIPDEDKKVLQLKTSGNSACGLGRYTEDDEVNNIYVIDPNLDYEITFMFKPIYIGKNAKFNFGVELFNGNKEKIEDATITTDNSLVTDMFFSKLPLSNFQERKWYFVRGIVHAYSSDVIENVKLNIGFGNQLTFNNRFVKFMIPKIFITSDNSTTVYIWNYKIRPLVRGTHILPLRNGESNSHSLGFIQSPRIFYSYFRNNNNSQSKDEITDIIERYLLPYNMTSILQFIEN